MRVIRMPALAAALAGAIALVAADATVITGQGQRQAGQQAPANPPAPKPTDPGRNGYMHTPAFWDWNWGELVYGQTYTTKLTVNNHCTTDKTVNIFINDPFFSIPGVDGAPPTLKWAENETLDGKYKRDPDAKTQMPLSARAMLAIPKPGCLPVSSGPGGSSEPTVCSATVPPGATDFEVIITTPAPPDEKIILKAPDPLMLYEQIEGKVVLFTEGDPPACYPSREEFHTGGHVHVTPPGLGGGPRCRDWWDTEEKPRGLTRDCTKEIRDLALEYLRVTLKPLVGKNPQAWAWLPTEEKILTMTIEQLIEMKVRSRVTMRTTNPKGGGR